MGHENSIVSARGARRGQSAEDLREFERMLGIREDRPITPPHSESHCKYCYSEVRLVEAVNEHCNPELWMQEVKRCPKLCVLTLGAAGDTAAAEHTSPSILNILEDSALPWVKENADSETSTPSAGSSESCDTGQNKQEDSPCNNDNSGDGSSSVKRKVKPSSHGGGRLSISQDPLDVREKTPAIASARLGIDEHKVSSAFSDDETGERWLERLRDLASRASEASQLSDMQTILPAKYHARCPRERPHVSIPPRPESLPASMEFPALYPSGTGAIPKKRDKDLETSKSEKAKLDEDKRRNNICDIPPCEASDSLLDYFSRNTTLGHSDIKNLLVLVCLEKQLTNTSSSFSSLNDGPSEMLRTLTPEILQTLSAYRKFCGLQPASSSPEILSNKDSSGKLHRKPAIRRRKYDGSPSAGSIDKQDQCSASPGDSEKSQVTLRDQEGNLGASMPYGLDDSSGLSESPGDTENTSVFRAAYDDGELEEPLAVSGCSTPTDETIKSHETESPFGACHEASLESSSSSSGSGLTLVLDPKPDVGSSGKDGSRTVVDRSLVRARGRKTRAAIPVIGDSSTDGPDSLSNSDGPISNCTDTSKKSEDDSLAASRFAVQNNHPLFRGDLEDTNLFSRPRAQRICLSTPRGRSVELPLMPLSSPYRLNVTSLSNALQIAAVNSSSGTQPVEDVAIVSSTVAPVRSSSNSHLACNSICYIDEPTEDASCPAPYVPYSMINKPTNYKHYHNLRIGPKKYIKVALDRLTLLALLDKNLSIIETIFTVLLILAVGILGCCILHLCIYKELEVLIFCIVMASCQYSLFKSVQPDAASPVHGYNHIIRFSRPIYFIICSSCVLALHALTSDPEYSLPSFELYGANVFSPFVVDKCLQIFMLFLLCFPLLFSLGLLPQINTFSMYFLEQLDIHMFGGSATTSLAGAIYCISRSLLAVAILVGFAYGGLQSSSAAAYPENPTDVTNRQQDSGQLVLYSLFCALLLAISYHLSRSSSDYATLWQLVKEHFIADATPAVPKPHPSPTVKEEPPPPPPPASTDAINDNDESEVNNVQQAITSQISEEDPDSVLSKLAVAKTPIEENDPLPSKMRITVLSRLTHDALACSLLAAVVFTLLVTSTLQQLLAHVHPLVLWVPAVVLGFFLHYIIPHLRKQQPWLCIAKPVCMQHEYGSYEVYDPARLMWFEKIYVWLCALEKNLIYPAILICAVTLDGPFIASKHPTIGALMVVVCGLKGLRSTYSYPPSHFLILAFTKLLFDYDLRGCSEGFLVDFFFMAIIFRKGYDFLLKFKFIVTYIAPWQITWGSAFHAFAQPFSVPHSAMLFLQAAVSAVFSTPLNPILGSAIFITSYVRPVKFWERDYNTKRMDQSNTRLSTSLMSHNPGADDNNLNSIFYEHLTRSLQHSLCGDLALGRWGPAGEGDCFVLASDNLNCLVHIVEMANGLVTFQVRGLEFRGTYCQQREVEAISEGVDNDAGCCCCELGRLPNLLSGNAAFNQRWLAWEVTATKYVLEGYSISDTSAASMFQMFDLRKILITYYIKSIIFHVSRHVRLYNWLSDSTIVARLAALNEPTWADLAPTFHPKIDADYDHKENGITRASFCNAFKPWIDFCMAEREAVEEAALREQMEVPPPSPDTMARNREELEKRTREYFNQKQSKDFQRGKGSASRRKRVNTQPTSEESKEYFIQGRAKKKNPEMKKNSLLRPPSVFDDVVSEDADRGAGASPPVRRVLPDGVVIYDTSRDSVLVSLCLALSVLGRRALGPASDSDNVEFFLLGLHALFKGDFRITCERDEWVFRDMELLRRIVAPAVRMSLKLHLDHFLVPDEYEQHEPLYTAMLEQHRQQLIIADESDPSWRAAVLASKPSLLALRHVLDDGDDKYKIIMLNKRHLLFRVIKVNRECVRGLWAGQQQELVYFRNRNPERGSIQNAKQALRNMINSSCDQPIGYPIYVSPLTTSFAHTHPDHARTLGGPITPALLWRQTRKLGYCIKERCGENCRNSSNVYTSREQVSSPAAPPRRAASGLTPSPPHQTSSNSCRQDSGSAGGMSLLHGSMVGMRGDSLSRGSVLSSSSSGLSSFPGVTKHQNANALACLAGLLSGEGSPLDASGPCYLSAVQSAVAVRESAASAESRLSPRDCDVSDADSSFGAVALHGPLLCGQHPSSSRHRDSSLTTRRESRSWLRSPRGNSLSYLEPPPLVLEYRDMEPSSREIRAARRAQRLVGHERSASGDAFLPCRNQSGEDLSPEPNQSKNASDEMKTSDSDIASPLSSQSARNRDDESPKRYKFGDDDAEWILDYSRMEPFPFAVRSPYWTAQYRFVRAPPRPIPLAPNLSPPRRTRKSRSHGGRSARRAVEFSETASSACPSTSDATSSNLDPSDDSIPRISYDPDESAANTSNDTITEYSDTREPAADECPGESSRLNPDPESNETAHGRVTIADANQIYDTLNLGRRIDVLWPSNEMRNLGGRNCWGSFVPVEGMSGPVVHRWTPHHPDPHFRSHVDRTILLVRINDFYVPVAEDGVNTV
ncbi:pecanex-like protein 1 isoform X1 [Hyalella azteca]|uniref:Pecanex-like protein n=1 Tax=Hyalella azteca TaxID=294128 RepID=A0A8B7NUC7_HYAAZ|nr:pecanex-like protein 1 isoform X1 [Hyalella azteca]